MQITVTFLEAICRKEYDTVIKGGITIDTRDILNKVKMGEVPAEEEEVYYRKDPFEKIGIVRAICISKNRGTQKTEIEQAQFITNWGIKNDAHAGRWHRQVSLLSYEKIKEFREKGAKIEFGAFGENLVVEGFDFRHLPIGTRFLCGEVLLEITQIGKECHNHCEIYKKMGECIMPREGVFARVLRGGEIKKGDRMELI